MSRSAGVDLIVHSFNDVHANLWTPLAGSQEGVSTLVTLFDATDCSRRNTPHALHLLVGCGDDHAGGSPWDIGFSDPALPDPSYTLFEATRVDAITLGNHDFDLGAAHLATKLRHHPNLRVVVSNLAPGSPLGGLTQPHHDIPGPHGIVRILGLISARQTLAVATGEVSIEDPVACLTRALAEAASAGVATVVVLSHLGDYEQPIDDLPTDADLRAGAAASSVPVLICGAHTHRVTTQTMQGGAIAYLQAGSRGSHLGMARLAAGTWQLDGDKLEPELVPLAKILAPAWQSIRARIETWPSLDLSHPELQAEQLGHDGYLHASPLLGLCCDSLAALAPLPAAPPHTAQLVALCVRTAGGGRMPALVDLPTWYRHFGFPDLTAWIDLPWASLPRLLRLLARRLNLPPGFREDAGFLHWDRRLRYRVTLSSDTAPIIDRISYEGQPYQADRFTTLRIHSSAYFCGGLGGYDRLFAELGFGPLTTSWQVRPPCLRDLVAECLRAVTPLDGLLPLIDERVTIQRAP